MQSNNVSLIKEICLTSYSHKIYLTGLQRHTLVVLDILVMILNIVANSAVVIVLLMSRFRENTSFILLFYLSVSDCFSDLIAQSLYAVLIGQYSHELNCSLEIIGQFFAVLLPHTSGYTIAAIAFDRYARMRFLNKYQNVVTKNKIIALCWIITGVSLLDGLLYTVGTKFRVFHISKTVVHVVDFLILLSVISVYLLTIKVIKDHQKNSINQRFLQKINKLVTVLASRILSTVVFLYVIYTLIAVASEVFRSRIENTWKSWLNFALLAAYLLTCVNSFANAVLFLTMNRKSKEKIVRFWNANILRKRTRKIDIQMHSKSNKAVETS